MNKEELIELFTDTKTHKGMQEIKDSELWNEIKDDIELYSLFEAKLYYLYKKEKRENGINGKRIEENVGESSGR